MARNGRISQVERRARIDTAHEALRQRLNRRETRALFKKNHREDFSDETCTAWKRVAIAELAEALAEDKDSQVAIGHATMDAVISKAFKAGELRTVVAAQEAKNRVILFAMEREQPSADAKLGAATAIAEHGVYATILATVTATDDETRRRMLLIEEAQDETVANRLPYVVNKKDPALQ